MPGDVHHQRHLVVRYMIDDHVLDRSRSEDANPFKFALIQYHLSELKVIFGGRYQTMPTAVQLWIRIFPTNLVVHRRQESIPFRTVEHGKSVFLLIRNRKRGVNHSQRFEDFLLEVIGNRHIGNDFYQPPDYIRRHAVVPFLTRLVQLGQCHHLFYELLQSRFVIPDVWFQVIFRQSRLVISVTQPSCVGHEHMNGDFLFQWVELPIRAQYFQVAKFRNVF